MTQSVDALVNDLRALGVRPADVVMVHASLRAIGPVVRRADGVLAAIRRAIGPDGTILMTLGARDEWDWVNRRIEQERAALLADAEPFDALTTPADPDVGALAEVFRTHDGTIVSDHPDGRFAANGPLARALTDHVPWDDYYGPGSPLHRFVDLGGRVLRLGADIDTVTLIHYAEYLTDVRGKRRVRRHHRVAGPAGPVIRTVDCLDDSDGIVEWDGADYFGLILADYLADRAGTEVLGLGFVGAARSELIDAGGLVGYASKWMAAQFSGR